MFNEKKHKMDFHIAFLIILIVIRWCFARDEFVASFISNFIVNENKPTVLVLCDSCWLKNEQIALTHKVMEGGSRVSSKYYKNKIQDHNVLFVLDMDCPGAEETIRNASTRNLFGAPYRWLILDNSSIDDEVNSAKKLVWISPVLADSDVVLAERRGNQIYMTEIHRPSLNHSTISTPRGLYNGTLYDMRPRRELYRRRLNLMGHPLTMSNVIQDSNLTLYHLPREDGLNFQHDAIAKLSWMSVKVAFLMLNATPRYVFSYRYGYKVAGRWSGMIHDLQTGRADVGTNCVVSNPERLSIVSYSDPVAPFRVRFVFRQPPLSYVANIYSLPFSTRVWLTTALCAFVSATALWAATRWEAMFGKSAARLDGGVSDAMFLTMSALSQQGCFMEPTRSSGRIAVCSVFVTLMALHAAYSANIVTLLQAPSHSIATLSQLVNSRITLAAYEVDYNHFVLKQYKDPVRMAVHKKIEPAKGKAQFYDINEGVERIRQGLFAMHSAVEQVYRQVELTFLETEKCDLTEIDFMNTFDPYVPVRKDSPYLELIRVALKRIRETGVHSAINRRHQTPKPRCAGKVSAFSSVGVVELKPVLALMAIGIAVSLAILCVEIMTNHLKATIQKKITHNVC